MNPFDVYGRADVAALTAAQASAWDSHAREQADVPGRVLMENAGRALAAVLHERFPRGRVLAVAGSGHNGGDALVAARTLQGWGREVVYCALGSRVPDLSLLHGFAVPRSDALAAALNAADIVIDGLLGTGSSGAPREPIAGAIQEINQAGRAVVAVDLPSGVDATTGQVAGVAVQAHITVSFGAAKLGLLLHPARAQCGRLLVVEMGFPPLPFAPAARLITPAWAHRYVPPRPLTAHKGTSGRVLLLAGSAGMAGAAVIAARAALSAGAGLVRVASAEANRIALQTAVPEATFFDRAGDLPGAGIHALVAGCGLGVDELAFAALERALEATDPMPALLDADALNLLAPRRELIARLAERRPIVLTPHVRELARISGIEERDILRDPLGCAQRVADETRALVVLKGQPSLIARHGEPAWINSTGSSDLATGGMGDQLSGVIGAFLAAGVAARDAAALGLFYGGRAADLAQRGRSLSPQQVSATLYRALRSPGRRHAAQPFLLFDQPPRW